LPIFSFYLPCEPTLGQHLKCISFLDDARLFFFFFLLVWIQTPCDKLTLSLCKLARQFECHRWIPTQAELARFASYRVRIPERPTFSSVRFDDQVKPAAVPKR